MIEMFRVTFKGILKDRVFHGILVVSCIMLLIPSVSQLSMRQVPQLGVNLCLSLVSFIQFLLSVFLGGTIIWKYIERRYSYSVLSLPVTRSSYLWGKFLAVVSFNLLVAFLLGVISYVVLTLVQLDSPSDRPIQLLNLALAVGFDALKYALLTACAFLFSTVSTSFFLPIFGTISIFLVGSATQEVHDFVHTDAASSLPIWLRGVADVFYYIAPNFSAFNLKAHAMYSLPLDSGGLMLTLGYFATYTVILLTLATQIFSRREMK